MDLADLIERLWQQRKDGDKSKMLTEMEMINLCGKVRSLFLSQSIILDLTAPLKICGDIHGQYEDLLKLFELCGLPNKVNYLFLGDYVDRGKQSLETVCLLFCYKLKYPFHFFLLRGNHECQAVTKIYGFFDECKRRFSVKLWKVFVDTFNCMPICAIIENQVFCCHGGLSPEMFHSDILNGSQLRQKICSIQRPCDIPDSGLLCDLLWSDPCYYIDDSVDNNNCMKPTGWDINDRGVSFLFGPDVVEQFLSRFNLDLIVRGHQVVEDGYEFYANRTLVTLFSVPNYCGEFDNAAAVFSLSLQNKEKYAEEELGNMNLETKTINLIDDIDRVELEGSFHIIKTVNSEDKQ